MRKAALWIASLLLLSLSGPAFAYADHLQSQDGEQWAQVGKASYYSSRLHGRRTASGEPYDETALTAAHPTLPFGTLVKVTNLYNERSVVLRINDRGPFVGHRIIDVSQVAAEQLGMIRAGSVRVRVEYFEEQSEADN
ncbi:MAG: septal ring lytic transglycosylase RlpA family protein [Halopseudomonas sp.]|uniref:septal ring lytic transglycosylase RlpA family protein n=1 Tax=Halopseudomonas sp. TaxID=2901191 RepID=UPI0030027E15